MTESAVKRMESPAWDAAGDDMSPGSGMLANEASAPFEGRWRHLISTTNWEKGRIIAEWRQTLSDAQAPVTSYSDEAWSQRVSGVTPQHVGRLRRVFQRFGQTQADYPGISWSHFQAALEWEDAEMWLEGAVQSNWSVSQMRRTRWETLHGSAAIAPVEADVEAGELDEDFVPDGELDAADPTERSAGDAVAAGDPRGDSTDDGFEEGSADSFRSDERDGNDAPGAAKDRSESAARLVRPFANLAQLPDDVAEAFEAYKLAILRHKTDSWRMISRDDLLASLDSLKALALAPTDENAAAAEVAAMDETAPF